MEIISHRFHLYIILFTAVLVVSVIASSSFSVNIEYKETKIAIEMDNFVVSTTLSGEWEVTLDRSHQTVKLDQAINKGTSSFGSCHHDQGEGRIGNMVSSAFRAVDG